MGRESAGPRGRPTAAVASFAYLLLGFLVSWMSAAGLRAPPVPASVPVTVAAAAPASSTLAFTRPAPPPSSAFVPVGPADPPPPVAGQDVAIRSADGAIWLVGWDGNAWHAGLPLGGPAASGPAVASWGPGRFDVFASGFDGGVWHRWWDERWNPWEWLGGALAPGSLIAAAAPGPGRLDLLVRGVDDGLWHRSQDGGRWSGWQRVACCLTSSPAVASRAPGTLDVFAQRFDRGLWHGRLDAAGWSAQEVDEPLTGRLEPAVAGWGSGRLDVVVRGGDDRLWHRWQQDGAWSGWEQLGCCFSAAPALATWGPGHLDVFARGFDNQLWHRHFDGAWRDWERAGGELTAAPAVTAWAAPRHMILTVPFVAQEYAQSCEATALQMALAHQGIAVSQGQVLEDMGLDLRPAWFEGDELRWGDPYESFVGDPNGDQSSLTGYGTYYPVVARVAARYGAAVLRAGEGIPAQDLYRAVLQNHPVVAWVSVDWQAYQRGSWRTFDGREVQYQGPVEHAVTVVGVDGDDVFVHDPLAGPYWISRSEFEAGYATFNQMAVVLR